MYAEQQNTCEHAGPICSARRRILRRIFRGIVLLIVALPLCFWGFSFFAFISIYLGEPLNRGFGSRYVFVQIWNGEMRAITYWDKEDVWRMRTKNMRADPGENGRWHLGGIYKAPLEPWAKLPATANTFGPYLGFYILADSSDSKSSGEIWIIVSHWVMLAIAIVIGLGVHLVIRAIPILIRPLTILTNQKKHSGHGNMDSSTTVACDDM